MGREDGDGHRQDDGDGAGHRVVRPEQGQPTDKDARFTDQVLVVAPNITVRDRLAGAGGLDPQDAESVYVDFDLIPPQFSGLLGQVKVQVSNWHVLAPKEDPKRSVVQARPGV